LTMSEAPANVPAVFGFHLELPQACRRRPAADTRVPSTHHEAGRVTDPGRRSFALDANFLQGNEPYTFRENISID